MEGHDFNVPFLSNLWEHLILIVQEVASHSKEELNHLGMLWPVFKLPFKAIYKDCNYILPMIEFIRD
jgi:hypothetical protein